jgi:hypothetical protein
MNFFSPKNAGVSFEQERLSKHKDFIYGVKITKSPKSYKST